MPPRRRSATGPSMTTDKEVELPDMIGTMGIAMRRIGECKDQRNRRRNATLRELDKAAKDAEAKLQVVSEKHVDQLHASHKAGIEALIQAVERRDQITAAIAQKHKDMRRELLDFTAALNAVYEGRYKLAVDAVSEVRQVPSEVVKAAAPTQHLAQVLEHC